MSPSDIQHVHILHNAVLDFGTVGRSFSGRLNDRFEGGSVWFDRRKVASCVGAGRQNDVAEFVRFLP